MKRTFSYGAILGTVMLIALMVLPVSGVVALDNATATGTLSATSTATQPFISATISPAVVTAGEPVTISGVATGGNLTAGVQVWAFAGNYVNISTVPVNADGSYSKTYQTTGLPPATYYVIVQSPGTDGTLNIDMETTGPYSGQVVNTKTGSFIFNFTGTGSVQDSAAAQALSEAFNLPGVDDVFTKATFQVVAPTTSSAPVTTAAPGGTTASAAPVPAATKSPLSILTILAAAGIAGIAIARHSRK